MNHKLAKKLEKAGFPFDFKESKLGDDTYTYPDLPKLIKACGRDFESLVRMYDDNVGLWWQAYMTEEAFDESGIACVRDCCGYESGDEPDIAVANLWLLLNENIKKEK